MSTMAKKSGAKRFDFDVAEIGEPAIHLGISRPLSGRASFCPRSFCHFSSMCHLSAPTPSQRLFVSSAVHHELEESVRI
jgi:hypothetical protein